MSMGCKVKDDLRKLRTIVETAAKRAVALYGQDAQIGMAIEELSELAVALSHARRGRDSRPVASEIADVEIMLAQMRVIFGDHEVDGEIAQKVARLRDRLKESAAKRAPVYDEDEWDCEPPPASFLSRRDEAAALERRISTLEQREKALDAEVQSLQNRADVLRRDTRNVETLAAALKSKGGALAQVLDLIEGRITHAFTWSGYGWSCKIVTLADLRKADESGRGRTLRMLSLVKLDDYNAKAGARLDGYPTEGVGWVVNRYSDGSGGDESVILGTSLADVQERAQPIVKGWIAVVLSEAKNGQHHRARGVLKALDIVGLPADPALEALAAAREEQERTAALVMARKALDDAARELAKLTGEAAP